jgi:DNA-binding transcriptional ArsR family regulator
MSKKKRSVGQQRTARELPKTARVDADRASMAHGPSSVADDAAWQAVRSPLRLQILEAIRAAPGIDARALSSALKTNAPRLYYHLNILRESGLIVGVDGKDGGDPATGRRGSRGPEAVTYRASARTFPDGFFSRHEIARRRAKTIMRDLFTRGLELSFASESDGKCTTLARSEHLSATEASRVKGLLRQIDEILDGARARRHSGSQVLAATHFVGCALCELGDGQLPDGPIAEG